MFLAGDAVHHVINVLRMKPGQELILFNGKGGFFEARIESIGKRQVEVLPVAYHDAECESPLDITLAIGISRGQRMDVTLQKAVELGVSKIVPIQSRFVTVKPDEKRQDKRLLHWQKIITGACEQCGRNRIPDVTAPVNFTDWVARENAGLKILLHPAGQQTINRLNNDQNGIILLAGPEGGFSDDENRMAEKNGYQAVTLGPRILRTETAPLAAITACQVLWGDLG